VPFDKPLRCRQSDPWLAATLMISFVVLMAQPPHHANP
jgi:hypothetical protein